MRLVDLSHEIAHGTVTYPGLPGPVVDEHLTFDESRSHYAEGTEFSIGRIQLVGNTGTYLDTPAHRYRGSFDVADIPIDAVANLPGVVLDAADGPLEPDDVGKIDVAGKAVLVRSGWDTHWATARYGAGEHPFVTEGAARRLVAAGAVLVGIDAVNIDDTSPAAGGTRPAHSILLDAGVLIVEHLCNLAALGTSTFTFSAVPVKVHGLGTFPVRAFAAVD